MFKALVAILFLSASAQALVPLRMTDKSENLKIFKVALKANKVKGLKLGDPLEFSINESPKFCKALVKNLEEDFLTVYVEEISDCWDKKMMLRRGMIFNFSEAQIEARIIDSRLTKQELEVKRKDFVNQLNDINIYLYNFDLKRKKVEAEYNNKIRELRLEKIKVLEDLYRERKAKSEIQLKLKADLDRVREAKRYLR